MKMKKPIKVLVSVLLLFSIFFTMLFSMQITAGADPNSAYVAWSPDAGLVEAYEAEISGFLEGSETTYEIGCADALCALRNVANSSSEDRLNGKTFKLTADIVFNQGNAAEWAEMSTDDLSGLWQWQSINTWRAVFDGNGHTISGIYIYTTANYMSFFKNLNENGEVRNLGIVNSYFYGNGTAYFSGMVGQIYAENCRISGCYSEAIVKGKGDSVGGFVGW